MGNSAVLNQAQFSYCIELDTRGIVCLVINEATQWAKFIHAWRKSKNLVAKEAAEKLGVPFGTYRGWESGNHVPHPFCILEIERRMKAYG